MQALEVRKQRHAEDLKADDLQQHFKVVRSSDARTVQALSNAVAAQRQVSAPCARAPRHACLLTRPPWPPFHATCTRAHQNRDRLRDRELALFAQLKRLSECEYPELRLTLESLPAETAPFLPDDEDDDDQAPLTPSSSVLAFISADLRRMGYRSPQPLNGKRNVYTAINAAGDQSVVKIIDLDGSNRAWRIADIHAKVDFLSRYVLVCVQTSVACFGLTLAAGAGRRGTRMPGPTARPCAACVS